MAMANFWIECIIDGRKTRLRGGPRAKDGGFRMDVRMRDEGESISAYTIEGIAIGSDPDHPILQVAVYEGDKGQISRLRKYR